MGFSVNITSFLRKARARRGVFAIIVGILALAGWCVVGAHIIAGLNPALKHELAIAEHPALDVWITPPEYAASSAPIIISTPAGVRFNHDTLTILQGSTISAHIADQDDDAPELVVDGDGQVFTTDSHGDFAATTALTSGKKLSIRRGWLTLASWKIKVIADNPPKVTMTEPPALTESRTLRVAYSASDDLGVTDVALRITPHDVSPGAGNMPVDITLPVAQAKQISRVDFQDLTAGPWAGQKVTIQIVATNRVGKESLTAPVDFTLPERNFFHPVARVLIEERRKLLLHPYDERLREETANILANIAQETATYHGDPVVMMALRSGAVRLILDTNLASTISVNDLLWQAATRIEDGSAGTAQRMLRDARQDLADAINHNGTQQEIQSLTDRLQHAMSVYLSQISARANAVPAAKEKGTLLYPASPTSAEAHKILHPAQNRAAQNSGN